MVSFARLRLTRPLSSIVIAGSFLVSAAAIAADWPQWRGPTRDGHAPGEPWPDSLDGLERVWRVELGRGYPGPIVTEDTVFVVETIEDEDVAVRALSRADGAVRWRTTWPSSGKVPFFAAKNGDWVRSTPGHDGERLYVGDMREVVRALDARTGEIVWTVDAPARFGTGIPDFGMATSPIVDGGAVYVQVANSVVKLDAETGETAWRALASDGDIGESGAFSSPVIATLGGMRQLVVLTRLSLYGLALDDGAVLWSIDVPNFRGMNILTPVVVGDTIFTSPYRERSYLYRVSRDEAGTFSAETVWSNPATGYMSSPVVIDGHAYLHLGNRRLDCIDLESGASRWRTSSFGTYWSMTHRGDRVLALDDGGELVLFRASPESFQLLDRRAVSDAPAWGHLAVAGDDLFVREIEAISAWRFASAGSTEGPSDAAPDASREAEAGSDERASP